MIYVISAVILLLIGLILFLPLKVEMVYTENGRYIRLVFAGVPVYRLKPGKKKEKPEAKTPQEKAGKLEKNSKKLGEKIKSFSELYKTTVKLVRKHVPAEIIDVKITVGTGDAATTAITTGALWGAVYGLLGILGKIIVIKKHDVKITPVFNNLAFSFEGKCIFKTRIAYIIVIAITILMKIKSRKGKEE